MTGHKWKYPTIVEQYHQFSKNLGQKFNYKVKIYFEQTYQISLMLILISISAVSPLGYFAEQRYTPVSATLAFMMLYLDRP